MDKKLKLDNLESDGIIGIWARRDIQSQLGDGDKSLKKILSAVQEVYGTTASYLPRDERGIIPTHQKLLGHQRQNIFEKSGCADNRREILLMPSKPGLNTPAGLTCNNPSGTALATPGPALTLVQKFLAGFAIPVELKDPKCHSNILPTDIQTEVGHNAKMASEPPTLTGLVALAEEKEIEVKTSPQSGSSLIHGIQINKAKECTGDVGARGATTAETTAELVERPDKDHEYPKPIMQELANTESLL